MSEGCHGGGSSGIDSLALLSEEHIVGLLGAGGYSKDLLIKIFDPVINDVNVSQCGIGDGFDGLNLGEELPSRRNAHCTLSYEVLCLVQGDVGVGGVDAAHLMDFFDDEVQAFLHWWELAGRYVLSVRGKEGFYPEGIGFLRGGHGLRGPQFGQVFLEAVIEGV